MRKLFFLFICFFLPIAWVSSSLALNPRAYDGPPLVFDLPGVERVTLPNGIRLYLKEDHELPLVEVTAMIGAGTIGDPADKTGLGRLYAALLQTGGAGNLSPADFDAELDRLAIDLAIGADSYATTAGMSMQASDLQRGLGLLASVFRQPRFDPQRLELARRQLVEQIRRQDDDPGFVANRTLREALYGDHPLGRTPTVETAGAVTREDLLDFHQRFSRPNNLWLGVSGDFDREQLMKLLDDLFGTWPSGNFVQQKIPPLPPASSPAIYPVVKDLPQTTLLLGERGIDKDNPDLYALRVMNFILGGGGFNSRLMREVRSNRGLAYSVFSYYDIGRRLPGLFIAGTETKTASVPEVVDLMRSLMQQMTERPVSNEELRLAKESLINSFVFAFEDTHEIVSQTMRLDFYDYPPDYLERYRDRVADVTVPQVLDVARRYLDPRQQVIVLVGEQLDSRQLAEAFELPVAPGRDLEDKEEPEKTRKAG
ncbi:MAG: pitrilysin family protein [Syntrophotaleaceae bacterium]